MERIPSGDVTETLIHATERAGEIGATHVAVILYAKRDDGTFGLNVVVTETLTVETLNWMMDKIKNSLICEHGS